MIGIWSAYLIMIAGLLLMITDAVANYLEKEDKKEQQKKNNKEVEKNEDKKDT